MTIIMAVLVAMLGSPHYRGRAAAHRALEGVGRAAIPCLERAAGHPDPEVARRAGILLGRYADEIADRRSRDILPTSWPRRPWLALYDGTASGYLADARKRFKVTGQPDWPEYREATRLWVRAQLTQRRPVDEIRGELDRMAAEERWWIVKNGKDYKPPIELPNTGR